MANETYLYAALKKDKGEYKEAVKIFTQLIRNQTPASNKDYLILLYKERAKCHFMDNEFRACVNDIEMAISNGFNIESNEEYFYMLRHGRLQHQINDIIQDFERQEKFKSWTCTRVIKMLKSIKMHSIFGMEYQRGRSQSADRARRR